MKEEEDKDTFDNPVHLYRIDFPKQHLQYTFYAKLQTKLVKDLHSNYMQTSRHQEI
jgi:hypothetical protein